MPIRAISFLKNLADMPVTWEHAAFLGLLLYAGPYLGGLFTGFFMFSSQAVANRESEEFGIKRIVTQVRDELYQTSKATMEKYPDNLFELKSMELELSFVIKRSDKSSTEGNAKLVAVGAETEFSKEKIQKIKLSMGAIQPKPQRVSPSRVPLLPGEEVLTPKPTPLGTNIEQPRPVEAGSGTTSLPKAIETLEGGTK